MSCTSRCGRSRRQLSRMVLASLGMTLIACSGSIEYGGTAGSAGSGGAGAGAGFSSGAAAGTPGASGAGGAGGSRVSTGAGGAGGTAGAAGSAGANPVLDTGLPGRALIRRLSNREYDATIATLLGDTTGYAGDFPGDTIVHGFTNNSDVQDVGPALVEQYVLAAEKVAEKAAGNVDVLLGCPLAEGEACVADFIERFGKRAWRRPIAAEERVELLRVFTDGQAAFDAVTGVKLLVQAFLVAPSFLYRAEVGVPVSGAPYAALTSWELASRLSYFLTGTMPDDVLLAAAEAGELSTPEGIAAQAERLLAAPVARVQVTEFFSGWLNLFAVLRLQREAEQFPAWNTTLPQLFSDETRAFASKVVFDGAGDLATLLTASYTYGDPSLAAYYGGTAGPLEGGLARIELPPDRRAGLLTQASFLATHSKEIQTDPVARGKFVRERLLCQGIDPPPPDVVITPPTITPGTTARDRFAEHEANPICAGCHVLIDPVGLAFENYDPIGQWRDTELGKSIDASGDLTDTDVEGPFVGVVEMAGKLAQSSLVSECFVRQWFRFAFGRVESDADDPRIATIAGGFAGANGQVRSLLVALTQTPDFRYLALESTP